ncbi:hypothetical protein G6F22_018719 [Rhizopus arrhizus]|uniref:Uncharacterized protein n=1 Tax=Rhizopus oryzae TaxID=64495 RepID=A0A9P6WSB9_RHIOR|nr:hypothetical protein G6F22_018719 [Rhizopus arrhizus]KAG1274795.1 hypothetical protein G6F64_015039 [Rhizopus arrhizus]
MANTSSGVGTRGADTVMVGVVTTVAGGAGSAPKAGAQRASSEKARQGTEGRYMTAPGSGGRSRLWRV